MMHSLGVSRCAGDIGKSSVNSMKMCVCGIGKRRVFSVVASAGAGDLRFAMILVQNKSEVLMSSMVGCVTGLDNKVCDDLGALFWFDNFGGCFVDKCDQAW